MKKKLAVLLSLTLAVSMLAVGCGKKDEAPIQTEAPTTQTEAPAETEAPAATEGALKTGLYVSTSLGKSTDAGEEDGLAQVDSAIFAVTVDGEGKVAGCVIDGAQTKINFSKDGKVVTDLATVYQTKNELGENYGMKSASGIGKDWNEQAAAFAAYCVGKTADEIKGIALTAEGVVEDADLAASVTIHAGGFINGVVAAMENATEMGAKAGDKLGLGVNTTISKSKDAADGEDGQAQAYSYYTATTVNAEGKITSCILDASQGTVKFDATGKITTDLTAAVPTKNEIGENYGMKSASSIGKEWDEQAAAFAAYCLGKTADEVKGIALAEGVPADADLAANVTVHVGDFMTVISKAVANAK
ncbi:hypothetical protein [Acetivibrio ethanolgignens]|uniref:Uncharacterized protein n=1 Tax=Acetivibrio ethanolgignens TaxID=290052 RepID=A0A0V8QAM0_9FIRM|nr:hypothetical protein [Acetivibrio ethanolgignens]KSV57454.1 hypothetical protein ASU35_04550 [Acetivibrio ethanolgignens]